MPRTFAYLRVSTTDQMTNNQLQEIAAAGFKVEPRGVITETGSANVATAQRRGFTRLLDGGVPGGAKSGHGVANLGHWSGCCLEPWQTENRETRKPCGRSDHPRINVWGP